MALIQTVITKNLCPQVRDTSPNKHLDMTGEPKKELMRLQEDKRHLQEQMEVSHHQMNNVLMFCLCFDSIEKLGCSTSRC